MLGDNKWGVVLEQARALAELEQSIRVELPLNRGVRVANGQVTTLAIISPNLTAFPEAIPTLRSLRDLTLRGKMLGKGGLLGKGVRKVPAGIEELQSLEYLSLEENGLRTLPQSVGRLQRLRWLCLEGNEFRAVPRCISTLYALTRLELQNNHIRFIPNFVLKLPNLQDLYLEDNPINENSWKRYKKSRVYPNLYRDLERDYEARTHGWYID